MSRTVSDKGLLVERVDDILGGIPVFVGTRVPVRTLFDYLATGDRLEDFPDDFPTVTRQCARAVMERFGPYGARLSLDGSM